MSSTENSPAAEILVVEDSRIQAAILRDKLRESGYQVRTAENGQIGLDRIRESRPTLVISDIEMPVMTGHELCRIVKTDPELRSLPFVLLSTLSDPEDIIKGLHCGADNYVTKPYDPNFLIARVASLLETPLGQEHDEEQLNVTLGGVSYHVKAGRQQVLNLLVSTFENAVEKNNELVRTNEELTVAKEQLTLWNHQLESLNDKLETANLRMSHDLDAAAKVQQSLLPTSPPKTPRAKFSWAYLPCDELAGDFLNVFQLDDDNIAAFVIDVSGHGVASSLLSVTVGRMMTPQVSTSSLLIRESAEGSRRCIVPPNEVAAELNRRFPMEDQNGLYFTMSYGVLNLPNLEFTFVSAGHDPIAHATRDQPPQLVEGDGLAIGWIDDMEYDEHTLKLSPGDRIYLYSDGVPEAMNEELEQFSMKQMLEVLELGQSQSLEDSVSLLLQSVKRWSAKNGPKDDVSILGIEIPDDAQPVKSSS